MHFVLSFLAYTLVSALPEYEDCIHNGTIVSPGYKYYAVHDGIPKRCECESNWHTLSNYIICRPIGCLKDGKFFIAGKKKKNCECVPGAHPQVQDAGDLYHWKCINVCKLGDRQFDIGEIWNSDRFPTRNTPIPVECTCTKATKVICRERGCRKNNHFYQNGDVIDDCRCRRQSNKPTETWERLYDWDCSEI